MMQKRPFFVFDDYQIGTWHVCLSMIDISLVASYHMRRFGLDFWHVARPPFATIRPLRAMQ